MLNILHHLPNFGLISSCFYRCARLTLNKVTKIKDFLTLKVGKSSQLPLFLLSKKPHSHEAVPLQKVRLFGSHVAQLPRQLLIGESAVRLVMRIRTRSDGKSEFYRTILKIISINLTL